MFGLVGKVIAKAGTGPQLAKILAQGSSGMPGNVAYLVALDAEDADQIWIHEVWESEAAHRSSLELPSVQTAIAQGRPLIERFEMSHRVHPVA